MVDIIFNIYKISTLSNSDTLAEFTGFKSLILFNTVHFT